MSGGIFLLRDDGQLVEMTERAYDSERLLQELLESHPALLSGDQIDPESPRRWLLVNRETSIPSEADGGGRWALDHLFIDQDGIPTLIEVKRGTDSRIRREVVGQMLDYAANAVVYWPVEALQAALEGRCNRAGLDADQAVAAVVGPNGDPDAFWQAVKTNLQAGRVRLVFVADVIPPELRRVVEFLNEQMDPAEVLALEVKQYVGLGVRSLVPRVLGRTEHAQQKKSVSSSAVPRQWDEASFFEALAAKYPEDVGTARRLLEWGQSFATQMWYGKGSRSGSIIPVLHKGGTGYFPVALWTYGSAELQFQALQHRPPFDRLDLRQEFQRRLSDIPGVNIPTTDSTSARPYLSRCCAPNRRCSSSWTRLTGSCLSFAMIESGIRIVTRSGGRG
jgi:hypothetical protein